MSTEESSAPRYPKLEDLARFAGIPTLATYGLLFLAYRNYYARLGISPEDVGVTNAYIMTRSAGFIFLTALFVSSTVAVQLIDRSGALTENSVIFLKFLSSIPFAILIALLCKDSLPWFVTMVMLLIVCTAQSAPLSTFKGFGAWSQTIAYVLLLSVGVAVIAIALSVKAHFSADQVQRGCEVEPTQYLAIPVLDFSARKNVYTWIGQAQAPQIFSQVGTSKQLEGLLVGRGASADFVVVRAGASSVVARIPAAMTTSTAFAAAQYEECKAG